MPWQLPPVETLKSPLRNAANQGPVGQRFGALRWYGNAARLSFDLDQNGPFIDRFVEAMPPRGKEKNPYPRKNSHLALFAAWNFAAQGKRTLIFSTQANWVEGYG